MLLFKQEKNIKFKKSGRVQGQKTLKHPFVQHKAPPAWAVPYENPVDRSEVLANSSSPPRSDGVAE
jgi:hypothetical protein